MFRKMVDDFTGMLIEDGPVVCVDKEHAASCKEHAVLLRMIFTPYDFYSIIFSNT